MKSARWQKGLIVGILGGLLFLMGCNAAPAGKNNPSGEVFRIGYLPATIDLLYFVAQEKGYFADEGLNTELVKFANSGEGLNAIKAGKLDVGAFGTAAPLSFIDKGAEDLTIIGGAGGKGNGIIALPERAHEFTDLQGYKGKKVATVKLANGDAVWRKGLAEAGLDWKKDLQIVELDSPASVLQAVKNKSVDAGVVWAPYMEMAEEQGLKIVQYTDDFFKGHPCCRQIAMKETISSREEDYIAFFKALLRAEKFYRENKNETIEIVAKYVKVDKKLIEADAYGGNLLISADPNKKGVQEFWEGMKKIDYVQSSKSIDNNINTELYREALLRLIQEYPDDPFYKEKEAEFNKANV